MWPNPQKTVDLVTFTKKSLMEKFIFCAVTLIYLLIVCYFMISMLAENLKQHKLKTLSMAWQ